MGSIGDVAATIRRAWAEGRTDAESHARGYMKWRAKLESLGLRDVSGLRVLDIGCGERAQLSLLFASDGAVVSAVDRIPVALGLGRPRMWAAAAKAHGLHAAIRQVSRDLFHTFRYWRVLEQRAGRALPFEAIDIRIADAGALPFPDGSFDLVVSSAVWEHLPDVPRATQEVARVLRDDGLAVIQIALFPSLQGGHHADWHRVDPGLPRRVRPWDHLRAGRAPLPVYLNEWDEHQYRRVFERIFAFTEWEDSDYRGAGYLTEELRRELDMYEERDLLLSAITAWARITASERKTH